MKYWRECEKCKRAMVGTAVCSRCERGLPWELPTAAVVVSDLFYNWQGRNPDEIFWIAGNQKYRFGDIEGLTWAHYGSVQLKLKNGDYLMISLG